MAGNKYVARDVTTGGLAEVVALQTSAGAGSAGSIPALNSAGQIDSTMMPTGIGPEVYAANASGAITAGDLVYVTSGGLIARASAAVGGNRAFGFSLTSVTTGNPAVMYLYGINTAVTGLTVGARYYLSATTPGALTSTPVSGAGAGSIHQFVGNAISATQLDYTPSEAVVLAS